jgi:hypothetical protein
MACTITIQVEMVIKDQGLQNCTRAPPCHVNNLWRREVLRFIGHTFETEFV